MAPSQTASFMPSSRLVRSTEVDHNPWTQNEIPDPRTRVPATRHSAPEMAHFVGRLEKPRSPTSSKCRITIPLEELSKYFDRPIVDASRELNVSVSVLQKICRANGVSRWPYRKLKSVSRQIQQIENNVRVVWKPHRSQKSGFNIQTLVTHLGADNEDEHVENENFVDDEEAGTTPPQQSKKHGNDSVTSPLRPQQLQQDEEPSSDLQFLASMSASFSTSRQPTLVQNSNRPLYFQRSFSSRSAFSSRFARSGEEYREHEEEQADTSSQGESSLSVSVSLPSETSPAERSSELSFSISDRGQASVNSGPSSEQWGVPWPQPPTKASSSSGVLPSFNELMHLLESPARHSPMRAAPGFPLQISELNASLR